MWQDCVNTYCMSEVPGALSFIKYARSRGVTVFFVTNRELNLKEATRRNLHQLGIDLPATPETLMVVGDKPDWTADKSSRRALLARSYRVLVQCGDDFGDFLAGRDNTPARRQELAEAHREMWGRRWFLFPNPFTGSWTSAVTRGLARPTGMDPLEFQRSLVKGYDAWPALENAGGAK
jgi:acid phosphatase